LTTPLIDTFGRIHDNLRISVTDRCNIRCFYCMPESGVKFQPREQILSFEEIERFVRVAVGLGVRKLRLTGGEPLLRRDLPDLIRRLIAIEGVQDLALTTNAVLLADHAQDLYNAGLRRLNIHLDTLDRERFKQITRRDDFDQVMAGIDAALRIGFPTIKINAVAVKNLVEQDIIPLARFGREHGIEIRYIEFMPLDSQGIWDKDRVLLQDTMTDMLAREFGPLVEIPDRDPRAPAQEFAFADGIGRIGFVASVSHPFCLNCNRIRLTSDGKFRYCLFAIEETDMRTILRDPSLSREAGDLSLAQAIRGSVHAKWIGHEINTQKFVAPPRPMYSIGG
jgi:cyclic pyranopterin phosphate synthase